MKLYQDVVTYYHTQFYFEGKYPEPKAVQERFDLTPEDFLNALPSLNKALEQRGLDPVETPKTPVELKAAQSLKEAPKGLDPFFVLACDLMVDTLDKRSAAAKLKAIGLTTARWKALLSKEDHKQYFQLRLEKTFRDTDNSAKMALAKNVESGDLQSIKYYHEVTGIYRPNEELLMNVGILVGKIMEILAKRVEPSILAEVADEFDNLLDFTPVGELSA